MYRLLLALMLLALPLLAVANPVSPMAISRLWFDDTGQCHAWFGNIWEDTFFLEYFDEMVFITWEGTYVFPLTFVPPDSLPAHINLSEAIPGFNPNPAQGQIILDIPSLGWFGEEVTWGQFHGFPVDIYNLGAGQSMVQILGSNWDGDSAAAWAKDYEPYTNPCFPAHRCTLRVEAVNELGVPASGVPVQYSSTEYLPEMNWAALHTGADGVWQAQQYASRTWLRIKDPLTFATVLDTLLYPEPDSTYVYQVTVSAAESGDPILTPVPGILSLAPSVLKPVSGNTLGVKYSGILTGSAELRLFDLRGRLLASHEMPSTSQTEWNLPSLANGIYFVGLVCEGRQLARERLTVLK